MSRDYSKGVPYRHIKKGKVRLCSTCSCVPCQCTKEQRQQATRAANSDRYNTRRAEEQFEREYGTKPEPKKKKKKAQPAKSKAAFTREWRSRHPTGSDADLKKALRKAGYSVGCLVMVGFMTAITSGAGWGIYEGVRALIG